MELLYQENHRFRFYKGYKTLDFPPHLHGAVEVFYFLEGESLVQCGAQKYRLEAGDLFIAFPNQIHGYEESRNVYGYNMILQIQPWLTPYYKILTEKLPAIPYLKKGSFEHTGITALLEMAWADQNRVSMDVLKGYFAVIFGKLLPLLEIQDAKNDTLRDMLMYIHAHYRQPLKRTDIARAVGYTESYVSHLFSDTMRTGLTDYINMLRVEEAKELLRTTDLQVTQIAAELGFGSIRNFGRTFRRYTAQTPKEYRKK